MGTYRELCREVGVSFEAVPVHDVLFETISVSESYTTGENVLEEREGARVCGDHILCQSQLMKKVEYVWPRNQLHYDDRTLKNE